MVRELGDREAMAAALVENLQRQDLNALEEAEGYRRLIDEFALTQDALGQAVGKSRSHVANTLRLLALPDRVRELLRDGALSAGHARALLTAPNPEALALQVVDRGLERPSDGSPRRRQAPRPGRTPGRPSRQPGDHGAGAGADRPARLEDRHPPSRARRPGDHPLP